MRTFVCPTCDQLVFFENSECLSCGTELGYQPGPGRIVALTAGPDGPHRCANAELAACNWLTPNAGELCTSCRLTRTRPGDDDAEGLVEFAVAEQAKRRLVFQLFELGLPVVGRDVDPDGGLAFDLLSSRQEPVTIGHADGVVTIDLAEGRDPQREAVRARLGEPYRTMLGHFRHETGHYYWPHLVGPAALDRCRDLFGDERADYADAVTRHYDEGAPADWPQRYVSSYATMHPWEDWAETFAHYLHIRDTLQTAAAYRLQVAGPRAVVEPASEGLAARPTPGLVEQGDVDELLAAWLPLTYALNGINRSMGKDDLYPFVIPPPVVAKLAFVHDRVAAGVR